MFHEYPYTDLQDLNLDWILKKMKELDQNMQDLLDKAIAEATAAAKAYIDEQMVNIQEQFLQLQRNFNQLNTNVTALNNAFNAFTANINAQMIALRTYVDDSMSAQQQQMVLLIQQNNEYLLREMESYLSQIKVINYFTGEKVTIQDMFNYLSSLHLTDAINYTTMAARGKTYTQLAGLNITYTDLAMHGNTLYV